DTPRLETSPCMGVGSARIKPTQPDRPAGEPIYLSRSIRCDGFGGVSRAAKGADCKSAGYAFAGASPASPTTYALNSACWNNRGNNNRPSSGGLLGRFRTGLIRT